MLIGCSKHSLALGALVDDTLSFGKERIANHGVDRQRIDIVISDVRMPNGDGISLLTKIRELNPAMPIVLLATGFADLTEPEALGMGANALIEKPIDRKRMLAILEGLVT